MVAESRFSRTRVLRVSLLLMICLMAGHSSALFAQDSNYLLGPGDKVRVTVYGDQYLSGDYIVSASGAIAMPLIELVLVAGVTTAEAEQLVEEGLKKGFMGEPNVSIQVTEYRPFFITGEVKLPGQYPFVPGMTLLKAVAIAGGFTPRAAKNKIEVQRETQTLKSVTNTTLIKPDDIITVKERFF